MTIYQKYPRQIDCVWIAKDKFGYLGVFITAGIGPIPQIALQSDKQDILEMETVILSFPPISDVKMISHAPNTSSYFALSQRGFYVFDWLDIEKPTSQETDTYEIVSAPLRAQNHSQLIGMPKDFMVDVTLNSVSFEKATFITREILTLDAGPLVD